MLLGIKYEAARIGEVGEVALASIEEQMRREVGDGWESDDRVIRGRNAVRREHGLPGLGEPGDRRSPATDPRRPPWRRLFGR
ncbi:MAG TPA: hypothetical protein VE525_12885 [Rubrobacter sp.]|nr:hypothetical protein [Rubrobacter sp.]